MPRPRRSKDATRILAAALAIVCLAAAGASAEVDGPTIVTKGPASVALKCAPGEARSVNPQSGRETCKRRTPARGGRDRDRGRSGGGRKDDDKRGNGASGSSGSAASAPPSTAAEPKDPADRGLSDPFSQLGANSPLCKKPVDPRARRNCEATGSAEHGYPLSRYGLDQEIETGVAKIDNNIMAALQAVAQFIWLALVFVVKGVFLLLEWGFSIDLTNQAMDQIELSLQTLHRKVIGEAWFSLAIAVAALWGMWRGFVQRQYIASIGGLAATAGLMIVALVLIANPVATVGHAAKLANDGSLSILAAASGGSAKDPTRSLSRSLRGLHERLVERPWCALEFGSVKWCLQEARPGTGVRNADVWLYFPTESTQRKVLYHATKGEQEDKGGLFGTGIGSLDPTDWIGPNVAFNGIKDLVTEDADEKKRAEAERVVMLYVRKSPERMRMQEKGGTFSRLALLAVIAVGIGGAVCLLAYVGARLLMASIMSMVLILLAPAMLLAPAFGDSGRATFLAWLKRLAGALVAKFIYSLLLAIILISSAALTEVPVGWFGTWLLQCVFWWGLFAKRQEMIGFVSAAAGQVDTDRDRGGLGIARMYYSGRAATAVARGGKNAVTHVPNKLRDKVAGHQRELDKAQPAAVRETAQSHLNTTADHVRHGELQDARRTVAHKRGLEDELRATGKQLDSYDQNVARERAAGRTPRPPSAQEAQLLAQRQRLQAQIDSQPIRQAQAMVNAADQNIARTGAALTDTDRDGWREQRRHDIAHGLPVDHARNLRAAGVDPQHYQTASPAEQQQLRDRSRQAIERDQARLQAVPAAGERREATDLEASRAAQHLPEQEIRVRRDRYVQVNRRERRVRDPRPTTRR